jgi:hypothetical protein
MLKSGSAQPHTAQRTGRQSLAFSLVAMPAGRVVSLPQGIDFEQETGKRSWQAEARHNFGRLTGNYSGCEEDISPSSESLASAFPEQSRMG